MLIALVVVSCPPLTMFRDAVEDGCLTGVVVVDPSDDDTVSADLGQVPTGDSAGQSQVVVIVVSIRIDPADERTFITEIDRAADATDFIIGQRAGKGCALTVVELDIDRHNRRCC